MNINYEERRKKLMEDKIGPCMVLIFSGRAPMRSEDESYRFSVDRNFYYLTGMEQENTILVMTKDIAGKSAEMLYIEPFDEAKAKIGARISAHDATAISGIQDIRYLEDFDSAVNSFVNRTRGEGKMTFFLDLWKYTSSQTATPAHEFAHKVQRDYPAATIEEIFGEIAKLRAIKSDAEIEKIKIAQETTRKAVEAMMKYAYPGVNECALEGVFDFELSKQGVREHAFPNIIAGADRATIPLHYTVNNKDILDGELVLIDLGSAHEHYCADISRTFPVNGKFTERQKEVYNIVLGAQELVIDKARPGMTYRELNDMVIKYYEEELPKIGLLKDGKTVRDYYNHGVSHGLGLDCHDVTTPSLKTLRPGMVITVEPGLYIAEEGIGVRIEDDIVITEEKAINLSANILKTVEDIEAFMKK